jgi:hypothetical protein
MANAVLVLKAYCTGYLLTIYSRTYLHYVLNLWLQRLLCQQLHRYFLCYPLSADFVVCLRHEANANDSLATEDKGRAFKFS